MTAQPPDRTAAHAALDRLLDAMEAVRGANAPDSRADAEETAVAARRALDEATGFAAVARFACWRALHGIDAREAAGMPTADTQAKADAAPLDARGLHDADQAARTRRALAAVTLADEHLFPPELARAAAAQLLLVNEGEARSWLAVPPRRGLGRGLSEAGGLRRIVDLVLLERAYVDAGFYGSSVAVARDRVAAQAGREARALVEFRRRARLTADCRRWQALGEQFAAEFAARHGRAPECPRDVPPYPTHPHVHTAELGQEFAQIAKRRR